MIDEIFAMIMKEARHRPGKDLVKNIYSVFMDLGARTLAVMDHLRDKERRQTTYENKTGDTSKHA